MLDIHLCQPDSCKSCAACCGLYNYVANGRDELHERLAKRTILFDQVRAKHMTVGDYRQRILDKEDGRRLFDTIYSCEYVGYLNAGQSRVGCMLHPYMNDGADMRNLSFYGQEICDGHFCPSYQKLTAVEAGIVLDLVDDWYLYGALITDIDYVKEFFRLTQDRIGEAVSPKRVKESGGLQEILRNYFELKLDWPYRDLSRPRFGKYYFVGEDYDIAAIDYAALGAEQSPFDRIFLSLTSAFKTSAELKAANNIINELTEGFISEY